jgi:CheY-like chemotaxis protein
MGCSIFFLQPIEKPIKGGQLRQILVVDDEPAVCEAIKMMLEHFGHEVQTASNGKDALSLLEQRAFDLVVTDHTMPGMTGAALAAAIKQRLPRQPVLMITAHTEMLRASGNPLTGVDFLLGKPFKMQELQEALTKVLPGS